MILVRTLLALVVCFAPPLRAEVPAESKYITQLRETAEKGDAVAQYNLGNSYFVGVGVPKNYGEAVKWFRRAADQAYPKAESSLGLMYFSGYGVPKNTTEALKWWRKAADHHDPDAQDQLGFSYLLGDGTVRDYIQAYKWFLLAESNGDKHAVKDREQLEKFMSKDQIEAAKHFKEEWVAKHPRGGK